MYRTKEAVNLAPALSASVATFAAINDALDAPYRRREKKYATIGEKRATIPGITLAERKLRAAIALGKLSPDAEGFFDGAAVEGIWQGSGRGNAFKSTLNPRLVNQIAAEIRQCPQPNGGGRKTLLSKLGTPIVKSQERRAYFNKAVGVAVGQLFLCTRSHVPARDEVLERLGHKERRRQMRNSLSWRKRQKAGPAN